MSTHVRDIKTPKIQPPLVGSGSLKICNRVRRMIAVESELCTNCWQVVELSTVSSGKRSSKSWANLSTRVCMREPPLRPEPVPPHTAHPGCWKARAPFQPTPGFWLGFQREPPAWRHRDRNRPQPRSRRPAWRKRLPGGKAPGLCPADQNKLPYRPRLPRTHLPLPACLPPMLPVAPSL